jgi:hypothetical protein
MTAPFDDILRQLASSIGLEPMAAGADQEELLSRIGDAVVQWEDPEALAQAASILEYTGLLAYKAGVSPSDTSGERERAEKLFEQATSCFRLIAELRDQGDSVSLADDRLLPYGLDLPFHIAVSGLVARRTADIRLALDRMIVRHEAAPAVSVGAPAEELDWEKRLLADAFGAFILLVRKKDGWADIDAAMRALARLRELQPQLQPALLSQAESDGRSHTVALRLVALFHVVQTITEAGLHLQEGRRPTSTVLARLDRHRDHALEALESITEPGHAARIVLLDLLWVGCRELVKNSIWAHVEGLGEQIGNFARHLMDRGRPNPVLELWPSQQEALSANILDQYRRAVLVQMPTSAGKTLLAEFLIIQSRALLPSATVAYIVPTRALVNQVTRDLRADLGPIGLDVEQAVPAYEMDPAEQAMLSDPPAVLVTTHEKLSLLLRRDHPAVGSLGLVVVDEAHNLADGERGARLELLLATMRRDRPGARYLLLSPFVPEPGQLVDWLGDDRGLPPVAVNWRPGRRVVGTVSVKGRRPARSLIFSTLDAADNADVGPGRSLTLAPVSNDDLPGSNKTIKATTRLATRALHDRGTTLILCWGPADAMKRAAEVAADLPEPSEHPMRNAVAKFLQAEYGDEFSLIRHLKNGVAYHHGGMSQEARALIECLVRRDLVHTVCGTTTLAQGVNFPISNVLIETRRKGRGGQLTYADLWNIVGRAGRALMDDTGLVAFPVCKDEQTAGWQEFLRLEAQAIASQLTELIDRADQLRETIGLADIRSMPVLTDMLQFLAHAMHVGGAQQTAAELEDLLRSSLVFRQASEEPDRANTLVRLCRRYLAQIADQPGRAALSDQTGFSTPTVGMLLGSQRNNPELGHLDAWQPDVLFGPDSEPLTNRMRVLGDVPELGLGYEAAGTFSPQRAAEIVSRWVNGEHVSELADAFGDPDAAKEQRLASFARYLYSTLSYKASWGLGAMESVYLSEADGADDYSRYVPSMVYFGVRTPEAVWMRMAGVPRVAAPSVGELWRQRVRNQPASFRQMRDWLSSLSTDDWGRAVAGGPLSGSEMQQLWAEALG